MNKRIKNAILGAIYLVVVSLLIVEYLSSIYIYLREGFAFRSFKYWKHADTAFVSLWMHIILRLSSLWLYKIWAVKKNVFEVSSIIDKRSFYMIAIIIFILFSGAWLVPHTYNLAAHYQTRVELWGNTWGLLNTISQYLYYIVEGIHIVWMISIFQTLGDMSTKKKSIPWGGIGLAFTWGVLHLFWKGPTQLIAHSILSVVMGILFLMSRRNFWPPFFLWMAALVV